MTTTNNENSEVISKQSNSYIRTINRADWQPGSERKVKNAPSYRRDIAPAKGKARIGSRSNIRTHGPGAEFLKLGSPEVRAKLARDLRITRLLDRTAGKLGNVIANRIATPKRMNEVPHFEVNVPTRIRPCNRKIMVAKIVPNPIAGMMKTSPRAGGNFPSRFVSRKDIVLSFHDRQEVISVVRTILAIALVKGEWHGERIEKGSPMFKAFYQGARDTLGMHKIQSKLVEYDAPLTFPSDDGCATFGDRLSIDAELLSDSLGESLEEQAAQSEVETMATHYRACVVAMYAHEKARKAHKAYSKYRTMIATCDLAEQIALGQSTGHLGASKQRVRNIVADFRAYVAKGAELLRMEPANIATELTEAWNMHAIE